jgi:hypothetical protein
MPGRILGDGTLLPARPFSGNNNRFFCMKNRCNALFITSDLLAIHERFCHSEHPLADRSSRTETRRIIEKADDTVTNVEIMEEKQLEEDKVYQTMLKMSSKFFDEFVGRGRRCGIPAECGEGKDTEESN